MQEHKYNVSVNDDANKKMFTHVEFLARVNSFASKRLSSELKESIAALQVNPEAYPKFTSDKITNADFRYKLCYKRRYRIVFEIDGNSVFIYDIQDCRQDTVQNLI